MNRFNKIAAVIVIVVLAVPAHVFAWTVNNAPGTIDDNEDVSGTVTHAAAADCVLWFGLIYGTLQGSGEGYVSISSSEFTLAAGMYTATKEVEVPDGELWDLSPMASPPQTGRIADHGLGVNNSTLSMVNLYCESPLKTIVQPH
jgi:hypothetical protein